MITHIQWFKLQEFNTFWEQQLALSPCARFVPHLHRYDIFDRHTRNLHKIGEKIMAKKAPKTPKFEWQGYVNIDLPEKEHSKLEKFATDEKHVFAQWTAMLYGNYQIKLYFDDYNDAIKCVATCYNHEDVNFGFALSSYADDWYTALAVMMYKHFEYSQTDWSSVSSKKIKRFG